MFKWRRQMRLIGEEELYNRYTNVNAKLKAENDQLDTMIVDATQTKVMPSQTLSSFASSKSKSTTHQTQQPPTVSAATRKPIPQKFTLTVSSLIF